MLNVLPRPISNQSGASLIQVAVSTAVMSVAGLGFAGMISNMATNQSHLRSRSDLVSLGLELYTQTYYPQSCQLVLGGTRITNGAKSQVVQPRLNGSSLKEGFNVPNTTIQIRTVKLVDILNPNVTLANGNRILTGTIELSGKSTHKNFDLQPSRPTSLVLEVDNSGTVTNCYNAGTQESQQALVPMMCESLGGKMNQQTGKCERTAQLICEDLGGSWTGSRCDFGNIAGTNGTDGLNGINGQNGSSGVNGGNGLAGARGAASAPGTTEIVAGSAGTPPCEANRIGTSGRDTIVGDCGNDLIAGLQGNDRLIGGAGNDTISGGAGADRIAGGTGRDTINGGVGADRVNTGSGKDDVQGGKGADTIVGGAGDNLRGGSGSDTIVVNLSRGQQATVNGRVVRLNNNGIVVIDGVPQNGKSFTIAGDSVRIK